MRTIVLLLLVVCVCSVSSLQGRQPKKDKSALEGSWKLVSSVEDGKPSPDGLQIRMEFKGNMFSILKDGNELLSGTFKLGKEKKRKTIDFDFKKGQGPSIGKTSLGIYEISKNRFRFCASKPGDTERPQKMESPDGSNRLLATLERDKK